MFSTAFASDGLETVHRYYTFSGGMVEDLERVYGPDAYWAVVGRFRTDPHAESAFAAIGTTTASFFAAFSAQAARGSC